jgi:hypothetical protein
MRALLAAAIISNLITLIYLVFVYRATKRRMRMIKYQILAMGRNISELEKSVLFPVRNESEPFFKNRFDL